MSAPIVIACIWVLVATFTALLPMRYQFPPGILLLLAAPWVIYLLGREYGPIAVGLSVAAFISMFRRPLFYLVGRVIGAGGRME